MTDGPMIPLPPAVVARLRTAESLRAELVGVVAERDAIRAELDTAGWERDAAQNEASFLREEVLGQWRSVLATSDHDQRIGLLLTAGDDPPEPPAKDSGAADVALVSLSTGEIYVRSAPERSPAEWSKYGQSHSFTDFATLTERGPWVTVDGWRLRDHAKLVERDRAYRDAVYAANLGLARWPESTEPYGEAIKALTERRNRIGGDPPEPREWIGAWQSLAGATRTAWEHEARRAEYLDDIIKRTPHDPEWLVKEAGKRVCNVCLVDEAEHLPIPIAVSDG